MKKLVRVLFISFLFISHNILAEDELIEDYAYYGFEPEIVTNYISNAKKLGFVRISVELMVKTPDDLVAIEYHDPLLRAAILEVLGKQPEARVKSTTGREDIRRECYDVVNRLLKQETGKAMVVNLLFTRYLYD